jgi:hypothetical protein
MGNTVSSVLAPVEVWSGLTTPTYLTAEQHCGRAYICNNECLKRPFNFASKYFIINENLIFQSAQRLGYGLGDCGSRVRFPAGAGNFLFTTASRTALGPTQPPIPWVPAALSLGVKRPEREADRSPPSSAEVKECVELYLHSPIRLHGVVLSLKRSTETTLPLKHSEFL